MRSPGSFSFSGYYSGLGLADFMLGAVNEFRQADPFTLDITQKYVGLYAQDTWSMSPNVTLNLGLRWEPWFPQDISSTRIYSFDLAKYNAGEHSTVFPQAPAGLRYPGDPGFPTNAGMNRVWNNVEPRVGISSGSRRAPARRRCGPATG